MVYEGGWGNDGIANLPTHPMPQAPPAPIPTGSSSNLPYKVNQIRLHFGLNCFSPILTDEDDHEEPKTNGDLASDLLNSLGDFVKIPNNPPQNIQRDIQREKPMQPPMHQQSQPQPQQQYQGYYGYGYQQHQHQQGPPQQNRAIQPERYMPYPSMNQGMPPPQHQVYNPLNPMASKFNPQMPPQVPQMYKNPLMGGQPQRPPPMNQYYRPPNPNEGYDPRYQGGYQQ